MTHVISCVFGRKAFSILVFLLVFSCIPTGAIAPAGPLELDRSRISNYDVWLEVDIAHKSIKGRVVVRLGTPASVKNELELDCGDLIVDSVREGRNLLKFSQRDHRLYISPRPWTKGRALEVAIEYHGSPRRGIRFFPDRMQVYTVFSTSQWMVCDDDPSARAMLRMRLVLPQGLNSVANGRHLSTTPAPDGKNISEWRLDSAVPTYTFGFAAGHFQEVNEKHGKTTLRFLATGYSKEELSRIFRDTGDMISFYEDRAGVKYPNVTYTQVLAAGGVEQEMSGFTALGETYGNDVLNSETDIWLGAHELAHQWWGIGVGCRDWNHFWLNEGMASFMADAYKEHRFGRDEYLKQITAARTLYEKVRDAGKDRSLVFPDWLHPTAEDRTLVYDKGAYVLHLLRAEMRERDFWAGIRLYTRKYFGRSVTTRDFQTEMQRATPKDLRPFFDQWVYVTAR